MEQSPNWMFFILVFVIFDILLVAWILWRKRKMHGFASNEYEYIKTHWNRIIDSCNRDPRNAVMDADKILDYALKCQGFVGTLGEKLKKAGPRFSDLNGLWSAHKLRNRIAHEMGNINYDEAKRALAQFKRALNDLGMKI